MKKNLIIFTRYPEIGKTKTRLIPAIGAEKACFFHKLMTEMTMKKAEKLKEKVDVDVSIYFAGGDQTLMKAWLGSNYNYHHQNGDDLGQKMYSAFANSFNNNFSHVVLIGTDCVDLDENILNNAFNQLDFYDLVIGKAEDGGYYLIALKQLKKELFTNIKWGSNSVFETTVGTASNLKCSIYELPTLKDIDRPEDLQYLESKIISEEK
ncbi:TIGR04282 family arsenosugar biosynthesis glycosyltransferase [Cyanobacterium sp. Dongsha4]|uniref:TIGR04282 family arsenosugar biosynthesis glycosyltransferase n=1 Tax=Cyanobacterium sp. DS4 TaxID=2878255 RepID=UPI002E81B060|nr:TIGR04282 family arsenosugar biosynthesis glycosyltransferase [Cyanobacterium sp. Dongsha4]WVK99050.1 TIGR04282 family arsenosugar biosynthesis glycosyltransferase [Cyanobacterium sp. Dongsha4]